MKNIVPHLLTLLQSIEQAVPGSATARIEARDHNLYINVHTSIRMSRGGERKSFGAELLWDDGMDIESIKRRLRHAVEGEYRTVTVDVKVDDLPRIHSAEFNDYALEGLGILHDDAVKKLQADLRAEKEKAFRDAITYSIGNDRWTLDEVKGRGTMVSQQGGVEVFYFDEQEMLRFSSPVLTGEPGNNKIVASQQIQRLYGRAGWCR